MADRLNMLLDLLDRQGKRLLALLTRLTLRPEIAEDLLQELFLKLRDSNAFAAARDSDAYATQTAVHLAFDWRRRQNRRTDVSSLNVDPAASEPSSLVALVEREQLEQVLRALEQLSPLNNVCIVLRYLQQESYESIALQVGRTPHQARALCHKGLMQLRQLLGAAAPNTGGLSYDDAE